MLKKFAHTCISASHLWQRGVYFPMCYTLSNHQQSVRFKSDNYDDLSNHSSQEEVFGVDTNTEAEMAFFSNEPTNVGHKKESHGTKPIKYSLAVTNKMLFGPLLETKGEKNKRLKREEKGITEEEYQEKQKKKKKKKKKGTTGKKSRVKPLITMPENAHYFGLYSGNEMFPEENLSDTKEISKEKDHASGSRVYNNLLSIKKLPKSSGNFSSYKVHGSSKTNKTKKIILIQSKPESDALSSFTENNENDTNTEYQIKEILEPVNDLNIPIREQDSPTLVTIDNSKFTAVPSVLDINEIKNFPLSSSDIRNHYPLSNGESSMTEADITTIGMFDGGYQKLPSVRKILDETMPLANRIALEKWKAKMIKELGEEGFVKYRQELLDRGKLLHGCIQSELSGMSLTSDQTQSVAGFWTSVKHVLPNMSDITVLESRLIHPYLYYQGAVDCVGSYKGMPMLVEWKTSGKPKLSLKSMFDDPLQVAAYLGALNFDGSYKLRQPIESAMLVVAYDTGLPAHIHILKKSDCDHYWKMWCTRLSQFWNQLAISTS